MTGTIAALAELPSCGMGFCLQALFNGIRQCLQRQPTGFQSLLCHHHTPNSFFFINYLNNSFLPIDCKIIVECLMVGLLFRGFSKQKRGVTFLLCISCFDLYVLPWLIPLRQPAPGQGRHSTPVASQTIASILGYSRSAGTARYCGLVLTSNKCKDKPLSDSVSPLQAAYVNFYDRMSLHTNKQKQTPVCKKPGAKITFPVKLAFQLTRFHDRLAFQFSKFSHWEACHEICIPLVI